MKIILARHGETNGDLENRYGGDYDDDMTERGYLQAAGLARLMGDQGIGAIYASPLKRAQQTAEIVASYLDLPVIIVPAFKERNSYGVLAGKVKEDMAQKYPEQVKLLGDVHNTVEGAEPYAGFKERITGGLGEIVEEPHKSVLVITHGGPISTIVREVLGLGETKIEDCAYIVLQGTTILNMKLEAQNGIEISAQ